MYIMKEIIPPVVSLGGATQAGIIETVMPAAFNFGIALSVTPHIRDDDQIRLWLNPEVRTKGQDKVFESKTILGDIQTTSQQIMPTVSWQSVWTNVVVHDGDTLVLGGLVRDNSQQVEQKMPYLADLPVIGLLFRGKSHEMKQSSLLIFVTPEIIDSTGARFFDANVPEAPRR